MRVTRPFINLARAPTRKDPQQALPILALAIIPRELKPHVDITASVHLMRIGALHPL